MKVIEFLNALNEMKKRQPHFDFQQFEVLVNGSQVLRLHVDADTFVIRLDSTMPEEKIPLDSGEEAEGEE